MALEREQILDLITSGVNPGELLEGIEIEDPRVVGLTLEIKARTPTEKRAVLKESAHQLIIQNRGGQPLSHRGIIQEIGGGPLQPYEWIQIVRGHHKKITVTGTRGIFTLTDN